MKTQGEADVGIDSSRSLELSQANDLNWGHQQVLKTPRNPRLKPHPSALPNIGTLGIYSEHATLHTLGGGWVWKTVGVWFQRVRRKEGGP